MSSQRLVCSRQGRRLLLLIWTSGLPEPAKANEKVKFDALFFLSIVNKQTKEYG